MQERHRQVAFPSPFTEEELSLDPEKRVWVPHRRDRIFVPKRRLVSAGERMAIDFKQLTVSIDLTPVQEFTKAFERTMQQLTVERMVELEERIYAVPMPYRDAGSVIRSAAARHRDFYDELINCVPGRGELLNHRDDIDMTRLGDQILRRR